VGRRPYDTAGRDDLHFEPFVHLVDVDDDQALVAWGGFWFRPQPDGSWRTVDDEQLAEIDPGREGSIGASSSPYGDATVDVFDGEGQRVASASTSDANHVWVRGLRPGTEHRYEITVDGRPWVPPECRRWERMDGRRGRLVPAGRTYDCRFRTFPDPEAPPTSMRFAALGDYGIGIQTDDPQGEHQLHLARVLERLVDTAPGLDLVITLGDNIYLAEGSVGGSGGEDDDWYFSYYEPYRFTLSRVPVYPTVGNHDSDETEASDDRDQLADNHFTDVRFRPEVEEGREILEAEGDAVPGLYYRFSFGRLVEFTSIDTSHADGGRYFEADDHQPFLDAAFAPDRTDRSRWAIPFAHHPAYCAGPEHGNDDAVIASLLPRYRDAGVQVVLAGHEHNFQHAVVDGVHHLVCGAGGKLRTEPPCWTDDARTRSWAAQPHLLLVDVDANRLSMLPIGDLDDGGRPVPIDLTVVDGQHDELPIVVQHPG